MQIKPTNGNGDTGDMPEAWEPCPLCKPLLVPYLEGHHKYVKEMERSNAELRANNTAFRAQLKESCTVIQEMLDAERRNGVAYDSLDTAYKSVTDKTTDEAHIEHIIKMKRLAAEAEKRAKDAE